MRENNLSFKNIFKRETKLATYIIAVSTILVLGLSYALFLQVNSNSQNQVVKSGDLAFTYSKDGTVLPDNDTTLQITDPSCFSPMTEADADSLINTCSYQFSIQNTGTLKAFYQMFLKATESNTANPEHLKVILRESDGTTFNKMTGYPKTMKSIQDNEEILLSGDLDKNSSILVYNIQIYLDEALADDTDYNSKVISYKLEGKSIVHEDQTITTKPTGAEAILSLVAGSDSTSTSEINKGTDASGCTNTLAYDDFGNLRYTGTNPCNYVAFNDETWRIIGVFDGYIKIVKNGPIGLASWDTSSMGQNLLPEVNYGGGVNQWGESGEYTGADLMKLLNPGFDENMDEVCATGEIEGEIVQQCEYELQLVNSSVYWTGYNSSYVYDGNGNLTNQFYGIEGYLQDSAKPYIDFHTWHVGAINKNMTYALKLKNLYSAERGNAIGKTSASDDAVLRTTSWDGYVGLIYA